MADFDPLKVAIDQRMKAKCALENDKFDPERYAFDNYDDEAIAQVQDYTKDSKDIQKQLENLTLKEDEEKKEDPFTEKEQ